MLNALMLALQVASTPQPLTIRSGDRVQVMTTISVSRTGTAVRADQFAAALGGIFSDDADDGSRHVLLQIDGLRLDFFDDEKYVLVGNDTIALTTGVIRRDGRAYLPYSFISLVLPKLDPRLTFDARKHELRHGPAPKVAAATPKRADSGAPKRGDSIVAKREANAAIDEPSPKAARARTVVVDAGHGGPDNGMTGPIGAPQKVHEKSITLAVSKALRTALEKRGIRVVMTRTTDTLIALGDRGKIANQSKADLFISVHVNAANPGWKDPGGARGYETYFLAEAKTEDEKRVAAMENEAIRFETSADSRRDDPLGFIIRDMAQNEHLRESSRLAELMQRGLRKVHPGSDRGVKQAGFLVLVTAFMPAVLVEVGFGSNRADAAYMTDPERQRELAESLADAAVSFLNQYDRKVGSAP